MDRKKIIIDTSAYSAFIKGNANIKRSLDESDEIFTNPNNSWRIIRICNGKIRK